MPKFTHRIVEGIKLRGLTSRLVSIEQMRLDRPGVFDLALRDDSAKAEIVGQFVECARRSIEKGRGSADPSRRQPDGTVD